MKPGYSKKPDEKQKEECVAGMKPGLLIQQRRNPGPRKEHSHSPSAEVSVYKVPMCLHPLTSLDETKEGLFPFISGRTFHKACGP